MPKIFHSLNNKVLIELLNKGAVGVLLTDTLYGLVCAASEPLTVKRLYGLKRREKKPGTIVAENIDQLVELGFRARYLKAIERYWPGAVSVVIPCRGLVYLHQGVGSVPVRISNDQAFNRLLSGTGPLLTTSANIPGQPPATTADEAQAYFGDEVDFYVDSGDASSRRPSTVIRVVDDTVEVLREGAVKIDGETGEILL